MKASSYKPKTKLLEHLRKEAGVETVVGTYRDARFNLVQYEKRGSA